MLYHSGNILWHRWEEDVALTCINRTERQQSSRTGAESSDQKRKVIWNTSSISHILLYFSNVFQRRAEQADFKLIKFFFLKFYLLN